jgi:hypothetical protein
MGREALSWGTDLGCCVGRFGQGSTLDPRYAHLWAKRR